MNSDVEGSEEGDAKARQDAQNRHRTLKHIGI
eukprot:CAMPEP_0185531292 /NCGR_PEP_ID=MMETSP1366-20130426/106279_1 /TAXON_ID=38817 /ORGANISM="Gephyrocapsa oceanica, Strain RCC1303" /LENGTH=31 /DNA_ID= /DNA_START= /DNA_END= /DNA_ORIENTATION=